MRIRTDTAAILAFLLLVTGLSALAFGMDEGIQVPRMTKEELKASLLLGNPDLLILDVRTARQWEESKEKIQGAVREDPEKVNTWSDKYPKNKTLVLYCSGPNEETSARVARKLLSMGFTKVYALKGGFGAWRDSGFPVEPK